MILEKDYTEVVTSGFSEEKVAQICTTPAMLRLLSSGLYSDKISAFIREWSTNAYDAMVEAGTIEDKTFVVHLPTKLEPWFSIRDYGNGLSQSAMENNFSNFGDSTKTNSNLYNGSFGIGSKSGLSYTRDFTITSHHNGIKTFYNYGLNDENIPVLSTAFSQPSDEPSGLEIQIAISQDDITEVQRKAELIYRYFDKRPETNVELEYHELPRLLEGDNWFLTKPDTRKLSYGGYGTQTTPTRVVMGNVIYPITATGLTSASPIYPLTYVPFVITVQIGDVQMTPSRETLEMTPKTLKFLEDKYEEIKKELSKNLEHKLDKSLCMFDKVISAIDLIQTLPSTGTTTYKVGNFELNTNRYRAIFNFPKDFHLVLKMKRVSKDSNYQYNKTEEYEDLSWRPIFDLDYTFVIVDSSKRIGEITSKLKGTYNHVYFIRPNDKSDLKTKEGLDKFNTMVKEFLKSCGNPKVVYASQEEAKLPPVVRAKPQPKVAGAPAKPKQFGIIKANPVVCESDYIRHNSEMAILSDDTNTYYYIESFRGKLQDSLGSSYWNLSNCVPKMVQDLEAKLKVKINLVIVSGTYISKARKDPRFIDFLDEVKNHNFVIETPADSKNIRELVYKYPVDSTVRHNIKNLGLESGTNLWELFALEDINKIDRSHNHKDIFTKYNYTFKETSSVDLTKYIKELDKYSDLQYLNYKATPEVIQEFIKMINNREDNTQKKKD